MILGAKFDWLLAPLTGFYPVTVHTLAFEAMRRKED